MTRTFRHAIASLPFLLCLVACSPQGSEDAPAAVAAARVAQAPPPPAAPEEEQQQGWLAVTLPSQQVEVAAQIEGRLREVAVDVGDRVEAGQRLGTIGTREMAEQRSMARSSLGALEADQRRSRVALEAVRERYERRLPHSELYSEEEMVTLRSQVEEGEARLESAEARVAEARALVAQIDERLRRGSITAPVGGTVVERYLDPGAVVEPGEPVVRLISSGGLVVRFAVPPRAAGGVRLGQSVEFRSPELDDGVEAEISRISPQVDVASEMVFMEAEILPPPGESSLQPGLVGRVFAQPVNPPAGGVPPPGERRSAR